MIFLENNKERLSFFQTVDKEEIGSQQIMYAQRKQCDKIEKTRRPWLSAKLPINFLSFHIQKMV